LLRPLTLLSGLNGMGKSSVIQALLLLRQSYQQGLILPNADIELIKRHRLERADQLGLALNGDLINIGTGQDALFEGTEEDKVSFTLMFHVSENYEPAIAQWEFEYDPTSDILKLGTFVDFSADVVKQVEQDERDDLADEYTYDDEFSDFPYDEDNEDDSQVIDVSDFTNVFDLALFNTQLVLPTGSVDKS